MDRYTDIEEVEFTIFDTETTGLDPKTGDRVVELAAIRFKGEIKISFFESFINPGRSVSPEAFRVNKISEKMLFSAPFPAQVIPKFMDFIWGSCLCSYNSGFDLDFLNNELRLLDMNEIKDIFTVDILRLARRIVPGLESYALWRVAKSLGIESKQDHRALSDVELTLSVFSRLKSIIKAKSGQPVRLESIINI